jgi:23S rRNA (guanosine2251-2'-O)-methyltransferase
MGGRSATGPAASSCCRGDDATGGRGGVAWRWPTTFGAGRGGTAWGWPTTFGAGRGGTAWGWPTTFGAGRGGMAWRWPTALGDDRDGPVILYGRNPVMEALRGRRAHTVGEVWATGGAAREPWLEGIEVRTAAAEEIAARCGSHAHQGLCADAGGYPYVSADELLLPNKREEPGASSGARVHDPPGDPLIVALDQVQDPQNLGSICRTAECAGVTGVVIPERRSAEVTPAVCKASAGAVEHLRIARVRNLADFLGDAQRAGCWSYGASAAATTPYERPDYRGGVVLVLGSEGRGLRPRVAGACDQLIVLPLRGRIESLGVSAAAAALLYEILHNRGRTLDNAP